MEAPNPSGLCMCGCGESTPIAPRNNRARGHVKGEHTRFQRGHAIRIRWWPTPNKLEVEWERQDRGHATPCWIWLYKGRVGEGYAQVTIDGKRMYAHRAFYEATKGPIPEGLCIDHLCRVRDCVNPDHLEAVTIGENLRRGHESRRAMKGAA